MRVSTGMLYQAGVNTMNKQNADMLQIQLQLATGRRVITPADDPVASVGILETSQALDLNDKYAKTHDSANSTLAFAETQLKGAENLLLDVSTLAIKAGNGILSDSDRTAIAQKLRADFNELLGITNAKDSSGQYIFAGYMGNTQPFIGTVENGVDYYGDDGQRSLQVSSAQQVAVSDSGNAIFNKVMNGNGVFVTDYGSSNTGSGVINAGSVTNANLWRDSNNSGNLEIRFWTDYAGEIGDKGKVYYDLVDKQETPPRSLFTGNDSVAGGALNSYTHDYVSGQAISFENMAAPYNDFGANVIISGEPASGDSFSLKSSSSQGVFDILQRVIKAIEQPITAGNNGMVRLTNELNSAMRQIEQVGQNVTAARSAVGARMSTIESLQSANGDSKLQYQQTLSNLQDTDYNKTISEFLRNQTQLQAAQKAFSNTTQLSLFNYIS